MPEKMQATNSMKDQKSSSKFAEGRLKLSTSCTECHRRKQKCDQKQPCKHCSRRFPLPDCMYKSLGDLTPRSTNSSGKIQDVLSTTTIPKNKAPKQIPKPSIVFSEPGTDSTISSFQPNVRPMVGGQMSPDTYDKFGPLEYQSIVGSMISNMEEAENTPAKQFTHYSSEDDPSSECLIPISKIHRGSQSFSIVGPPSRFGISSVDPLHFIGITPTRQSGELLHAFVKVITRYVVSLDGNVKPNYYNDTWVPWTIKSPLLAQFAIFTASCYQSEVQRIPPQQSAVVLGYKLKSIGMLNELLRNQDTCLGAEAMTAVNYLTTNEWYWSNFENVQAHLKGLKEIVRLRGGLGALHDDEKNQFQRAMIILLDYQVSGSYEIEMSFPHNISTYVTYPASMSCPLLYSLVSFSSIHEQIGIGIETATILDHIRIVFMAVMKLIESSQTPSDTDKVTQFTLRIQSKVSSLSDALDVSSPLNKDFIYKSCRFAALVYCKAIIEKIPLSQACTSQDLAQLWSSMWRVTLSEWKRTPGIFMWVILAGNPAAQGTPHGRFQKSMLKSTSSYIALDYFDVADASLMTYMKLQRWLREQKEEVVVVAGSFEGRDLPYLHRYGK